jgi:hypothetical protein
MKFPYRKEPSLENRAHPGRTSVLRPRIRVRLKHKEKSVDLLALIDSGADDCLFPMEVAEVLGLQLDSANRNEYSGIGEGQVTAIFGTVSLEVGGWPFELYAGFTDSPSVVPILGQHGFFSLFEVKFNLSKEEIELKPIKR